MSLLVKAVGRGIPSQEIVLARGVVTAVLSWAMIRRAGLSARGRERGLLLLRGVLGFAALSCFFYALVHLPLADATVIQYTSPVFTALIAALVLSEGMGSREVLGVGTGLAGVILVARPSFLFGGGSTAGLDPVAVGVALAGAVLSAGAYVTVRRLGRTEDPLVVVLWFSVIVVAGSIPTAAPDLVWPTPWGWVGLAGVGVATQVAQVYLTRGLKLERAGRATAVGYLQIVFAALWGALFFGEIPDAWSVAGALLVIGGTFLLTRGGGAWSAPASSGGTPGSRGGVPEDPSA